MVIFIVNIIFIVVHAHEPLLSNDSLLDVLGRIQSLTIIGVARWDVDSAIFADLIGELRPRTLRITIVERVDTPSVVGHKLLTLTILYLHSTKQLLQSLVFKTASFYLIFDLPFKSVAILTHCLGQLVNHDSIPDLAG